MKHILLNNLIFKENDDLLPPKGFHYDNVVAAWISWQDRELLVFHEQFNAAASKKRDVEIGEDQK